VSKLSYDLEVQNCLRENLKSLLGLLVIQAVSPENKLEANSLIGNLIDDLYISQYDFVEEFVEDVG
jgi:hypothetical protein